MKQFRMIALLSFFVMQTSAITHPSFINALQQMNDVYIRKITRHICIIGSPENQQTFSAVMKLMQPMSFELHESFQSESSAVFSIILLDSIGDFAAIKANYSAQSFNDDGHFLITLTNDCRTVDQQQIFDFMWHHYAHNVNVMCREADTVSMFTFMPFSEASTTTCGDTTPVRVNSFSNDSSTWALNSFYPDKLTNLFGCPIKVATFFYPPIIMRDTLPNGSFRYYGSEIDLMYGLAEALNFSVDITYMPIIGSSGLLFENGTATGIIQQTIQGDMQMLMGFYYLTFVRTRFMSFTQSHYSIPLIIQIPPGESLSSFEKLFRPFQNVVWIFLLVTFASGFIVIALISQQREEVKAFIFGASNRTPYLNMITIFVGGSQHNLPKRNFARSLLMMFMLFCLVQRALYQGSLYQFLQSDDRSPELQTIDEMMEKNFVFYIRETLEHNIKRMSFYSR